MAERSGGRLIVEALEANGVERIYSVPGESFLAVLDALHDSKIRNVVCRQEGGAAMMADCEGRLTGKPGICFVTRGPGATNAAHGVHIARQDSNPMILFIGQNARHVREREGFQEMDYRAFFGSLAKWVVEIEDAARIPEFVTRAFAVATSGRPGPVVVALPEDMLSDVVEAPAARPFTPVETAPDAGAMARLGDMLRAARRPIAILGGGRWSDEAVAAFGAAAGRWKLPVGVEFRRQMLFDHNHPSYVGDVGIGPSPALAKRIKEADLVLLVGGRFGEVPSSDYTLLESPYPRQTLVHVHPDPEELGRVYRAELAINASPHAFALAFAALNAPDAPEWADDTAALRQARLAWATPPETSPGAVAMGPIIAHIAETLPDDAILANGAGNYATWVHRFYPFRRFATQAAPTNGSMGYGTPAAVAAKLAFPEREVLAFAGDGCFMMNGQEFATAMQHGAAIVVIVVDNGMYGTIRMHQEREYPARISGTALQNPDFAALARAYGGHGETVTTTEEFAPAFARARAAGKPALIHILLDPEAITPTRSLSQIRQGR